MAKDVKMLETYAAAGEQKHCEGESTKNPSSPSQYWPSIVHRNYIPTWLRDNDYILTGHPMPTNSCRRSFRLWHCLHMETMNIWTHFLGCAAFVANRLFLCNRASTTKPTTGDVLAFDALITSAIICFGLSATFHTLRSHSYRAHHLWGKMDILGICVLAFGGGVSAAYYAAAAHPILQRLYWILICCSSAAIAYTLVETGGGGSKMRSLRAGVFQSAGTVCHATCVPRYISCPLVGKAFVNSSALNGSSQKQWRCWQLLVYL